MTTAQPPSTPRRPVSRRNLMKAGGLGLAAAPALAACGRGFGGGGDDDSGDGVTLNMVWWGDATRAEKTQAALDAFTEQNEGVTIEVEYQDSGPYQDKLATRFAAGDPPDLMAMRMDSLREYADRGALLDLAEYAGDLDLSGLSDNAATIAEVGDSTYGVPAGLNTIGFVVRKDFADQYGVAVPDGDTWSWEDLAAFAKAITDASGGEVYGTGFEAQTLANILVFTRQRGEDFFTDDDRLGVTAATVQAWFELIDGMRADGGFPPAGFFENIGGSADQSYIAQGKLASQIIPTNNFLGYNEACGGTLELLRIPGETQGARRGQSIDCPHLWSVASASKHPETALKLLDFLLNDPAASLATGTTRGVPANSEVAEEIKPSLEPDDQLATDYLIALQGEDLPRSLLYPPGGSAVFDFLDALAVEVEFGRVSPADAAAQFIEQAEGAIAG
ncbi:ABC transporter substrate-binding protein [Glycomyces mayteni]|uniref:ABC transporter substrate-binding protein n=1 Tax=Glycomyces mayteni TaxID=543887 RepID=A0ABW2DFZ3_9ACTN